MAKSRCHSCGTEWAVLGQVGRGDACQSCGADLRCCLMCRHHDEHAANHCREPHIEPPRERDRSNFCDYFMLGAGGAREAEPADEAKQAFDRLFSKR